ncbi:polysaccharide biosynthesis tyrosine autokinase [Aureliella helgolandensis]|uniref:Tyrosine-protein kinase etk n=1 Tax=Aureliella helgolandensis TaxID=2527968 RepID=A0A518GE37_9BACT|nr:polysaccharide biosynthesis tyrosine autokinase [Aureliella helgolandensis]QDV26808.1 Tyrosine-protein kinase etk [Aureliella helgolandensis]
MQNPATAKNASPPAFDPWLLWIAFRKHWGWVLPMGFLFASAAGLAVWSQFVPEFEATHIMEANRDYVLAQSLHNTSRDLARSERQLITNALVLDPVLADPALKKAPSLSNPLTAERQIRKRLSIGNAGTDNLLTISYRDTDKVMAAAVCNAVAESYLQVRRRFDDERMGNVEAWLVQPIEQWKRNVESLRANLAELTKSANGYDPFKESSPRERDASQMVQVRSELSNIEAEKTVTRGRINALQSQADNPSEEKLPPLNPRDIDYLVAEDSQVQKAKLALEDVKTKIRNIEREERQELFADRYARLKEDVPRLEEDIRNAEVAARPQVISTLQGLVAEREALKRAEQIEEFQLQLDELDIRQAALQKEYEVEKSRLEKQGGETAEIFFAREDYEQAAEILSQLNNRLATLRTERGRGSSVSTMAAAKVPSWPIEEIPFKKVIMAGGAAFLLPFALALLLEFRMKRLTHVGGIEAQNLAPVLGEIARIPGGARSTQGHRLFEESIDALRANLLFKLEGARTIAVTSAMSSEGKSSVASQLAISLAKTSQTTVLLIDADLRSPDQHDLFGLPNEPGLCKLLGGQSKLSDCIDKSLGDLVHVIPAGRLHANPHNLLTKSKMEKLFADLESEYRYIVVDTAPVLPASETLAATSACDATLLCAMRDISRTDHVKRTQNRLLASGTNVIGVVFSGVPSSDYAYRYGDYHYTTANLPPPH